MKRLRSMFKPRGKRIGLIFVREQGLDLELWKGGSCPCWSMGVVRTDTEAHVPAKVVGIPKAPSWLMILPTYLCTTRCIELPSSRAEEVAAMLEFEVPQLVPCRTQPWTWDYCIVDQRQDGTSQILVILSPLSVVESAMEQVHALGVEPNLVTVSATLRAMRLTHGKDVNGAGLRGYAWWDDGSLDFCAMDRSRLVFLRGVRVCGQDARARESVEAEVGRSLSMLREWSGGDVESPIHIGGTSPEIPRLVERLGQIGLVGADQERNPATYAGSFVSDGARDAISSGSWRNGRTRVTCVNLLPAHRKEKDRRARRHRQFLGLGLRACLVALLMLLCLRMSVWRQTGVLRQYRQRLAQIAPLAEKLQFLQSQLNMIQTQVQGSVSMLDILGQLYEVLPEDVTIHHLSIDQNRQAVIRAQAKWLSQAFDCIDPLEQSRYLSNVRQSYAHLRELEGQILIDFELRADLEKGSVKEVEL